MAAQLCCLQSMIAFDSPPPSFTGSLHQILYLLNSPTTCLCRGICLLSGPKNCYGCCQFLPSFWRRQKRERQRKVNRWTAAVLGLPYRTMQPAGSLISLPLFPSKISLSPSFHCDVPVGFCLEYWNSLCLVLFVRHSVRIPPPTHSWLRNVLRLPSQVSTHFITSLCPNRSLFFLFSLTFSLPLPTSLHSFISFPHHVPFSICLLVFSGMADRKGLAWWEESVAANAHKLLAANTKSCFGDRITYG